MAHKTFYVTRDQRHPLYKTRMLQAGEELTLSASAARLFNQLGAELSENAPKKARAEKPVAETPAPAEQPAPDPSPEPKTVARKRTTRKTAARKR